MHISLLVKSVTEIMFTSGEGPGSQGGTPTVCIFILLTMSMYYFFKYDKNLKKCVVVLNLH